MKTLGARLSYAIEQWEPDSEDSRRGRRRLFQEAMRERLPGGMAGTSYRVLLEYLRDRQTPSLEWLREAADLTGFRLAWLVANDGPPTEAEAELERSKLQRRGFTDRHAEFIASLDPRPLKEAEQIRRALERFSRTLDAAAFTGAPWYDGEGRRDLLRSAADFLGDLDGAAEAAARQSEAVLRSSNSDGWLASWYDAALSLFSRRVVGLGIRSDSHTDQHEAPAEASHYAPIIGETTARPEGGDDDG